MTRRGLVPTDAPFPRRIGLEVAGSVEAVGEGAVYWDGAAAAVGDELLGRAVRAASSRVVVPASGLTLRPDDLSIEQAAALNIAGLTALSRLATIPSMKPTSSSSAVLQGRWGSSPLSWQRNAAAVSSAVPPQPMPICCTASASASASNTCCTAGTSLATRVAAIGEPTAVIDCHGRDALDTGVALGVPVGRMVAIADYQAVDELGVHGVERDARTASNLARLADALEAGTPTLPIAATFGLDEAADAFRALDGRHAPGKIVVML